MDWSMLLSTRRFQCLAQKVTPVVGGSDPLTAGLRTDYHVDHDRIVFSSAFRRLGRKTQVHSLSRHDHAHNRLTHSIEVASVGRSLGNRVGAMLAQRGYLPESNTPFDIGTIVQVACLAHDIGNPPFGHTGEDALREWFCQPAHQHYLAPLSAAERLDIETYEGNAHGLRTVSRLEMYGGAGGMRLTSAVLGALMKYPWTSEVGAANRKFGVYQSELPYFQAVAETLGLPSRGRDIAWARHPLSYLMEAADDLCYAIVDLEDAVEMGMLAVSEFEALFAPLANYERALQEPDLRQRCAMLRGMAVGHCVAVLADRFMAHHDELLAGTFPEKDLIAVCEGPVRDTLIAAKALASQKVYRHRDKLVTEIAAYPCLGALLSLLVPAAFVYCTQGPQALTHRQGAELALLDYPFAAGDSLYSAYMRILDFIGGMTDNTAARLAREVSGVGLVS